MIVRSFRELLCWTLFIKQKNRKRKWNSYWKNEEISRWKAHTNTQKLNWIVMMITCFSQSVDSKSVWTHGKDKVWLEFWKIFPPCPQLPPFLSCTHSGGNFPKVSSGAVFTVCLHTFTLFCRERHLWSSQNFD